MPQAVLTMTRQEVAGYFSERQYAGMRIYTATGDYTAARCCILNGLFSGFVLASEAIEKLLKAAIYLETGEEVMTGHDSFALKEKLKRARDYGLDGYDEILKKLYLHYQSRYHENHGGGASSRELVEIDALWLELMEKLPIPDEAKYRTAFYSFIAEPNEFWRNDVWLTTNNQALAPKMDAIKTRYQEVFRHLYPSKS